MVLKLHSFAYASRISCNKDRIDPQLKRDQDLARLSPTRSIQKIMHKIPMHFRQRSQMEKVREFSFETKYIVGLSILLYVGRLCELMKALEKGHKRHAQAHWGI